MISRRNALKALALSTGAAALSLHSLHAQAPAPAAAPAAPAPTGPFTLPKLPYAHDVLEPFIDAKTMEIHHSKHHQAYVDKLNAAVAKLKTKPESIEALLKGIDSVPEELKKDIRNQGGGHANHTLFWSTLKKNEGGKPVGELAAAIDKAFGSYDDFWKKFADAGTKVFGSGWAWLVIKNGKLNVDSTPNQDSPLMKGNTPLLGMDVWEHAYYLKYMNKRADYIAAFKNVINWEAVNELYTKAAKA